MGSIGMPELIIILFISLVSLAPIALGVWLLVIVVRMRAKQSALEAKVEALERGARQP